jgi:hypothetical protein
MSEASQCRGKRHLKARMHDCLRRHEQHGKGGDGDGAEGERRPVEHDADQHDGDHDEGALGGHARPRQHEIEGGGRERPRGGPFLDRAAAGEGRDQGEAGAQEEEGDAGDLRHVVAGDRQHMGEA